MSLLIYKKMNGVDLEVAIEQGELSSGESRPRMDHTSFVKTSTFFRGLL